jgi:hypothetical protein
MFSPEYRETLRQTLISNARDDDRISGAGLTGSAALDLEDRWSDIDLAFGVIDGHEISQVISDWTVVMYQNHGAVHHMDMASGDAVFRVFFLQNTLQVDLSFSPAESFGAVGPSFQLIFGTAHEIPETIWPSSNELIGLGWLYALHARSSIARNRYWQAEYMLSGFRDQTLALACLCYGVSPNQGRGIDKLPTEMAEPFVETLVRSLEVAELKRAYRSTGEAFIAQVTFVDLELAARLEQPLRELTRA